MNNTKLEILEALMLMVDQFFYSNNESNELSHSFMSAEETAIAILIDEGLAEEIEVGLNGYILRWDKLEERKQISQNQNTV